jgi:hypothetical protein
VKISAFLNANCSGHFTAQCEQAGIAQGLLLHAVSAQ